MSPKFLVAALALAFVGQTFAAGEASAQPAAKRPSPAKSGAEDVLGRAVYQALLGEFALRQGDSSLAVSAWGDLAIRTRDPQAIERAIEVLIITRKFDAALELADLWRQVEPESAKVQQIRSSLLLQVNRFDELTPQIAALLAQDAAAVPANLMHLNRLLGRHTDKKAVQILVDRVTAPYGSLPEAHFAMSQAASNAGDDLRALTEIEKSLLLRPDWEPAALIRTQLQVRQSLATAIDGLRDFVRRYPVARDARLTLARLLISEKYYDEARSHFDVLIKEVPNNPEVIYPLAMLALQQGDAIRGREQLEHLLETEFPDKSTIHFFIGQIDEENRQFDSALDQYLRVTTGDQFLPARIRTAILQQKQGRHEAARETLRSTRTNHPAERTQLLLAESQVLREIGQNGEAYALLEINLDKQPDNVELLYEAALLAERLGKPALLEKHLQHLLKIKPDHAHALNALGYSWAERNIRLDEAEKLIGRALQVAPDDAFITDSLGWVFFRQGRLNEALSTLQKAYALKDDGEIAAHLGEVLWVLNRQDEARQLLQAASRQHPENEALRAIIKKILP